MKVLALIGSPRKDSNTDILVDKFLEGSRSKGSLIDKLYLYEQRITPCVDCRSCKKGDLICKVKDDMQKVYSFMDAADVIVFGTPVYWYGPSAPTKLVIDRMRPYGTNNKLRGKRAVLVAPSAARPEACQIMVDQFRLCFDYLDIEFVGSIMAQAYDKGEIKQNPEALKKAYDLGASL